MFFQNQRTFFAKLVYFFSVFKKRLVAVMGLILVDTLLQGPVIILR